MVLLKSPEIWRGGEGLTGPLFALLPEVGLAYKACQSAFCQGDKCSFTPLSQDIQFSVIADTMRYKIKQLRKQLIMSWLGRIRYFFLFFLLILMDNIKTCLFLNIYFYFYLFLMFRIVQNYGFGGQAILLTTVHCCYSAA